MAPKLAAHQYAINLNPALFARIESLYENREGSNLSTEDSWLLERYYMDLLHAGAHLNQTQRDRLKQLNEELPFLKQLSQRTYLQILMIWPYL